MTLDDEEDVNGFKQTSMGKRAEKRKAHVVGQGKRGRKGGDPALAFGDTPYEPSKPCDYVGWERSLSWRPRRRLGMMRLAWCMGRVRRRPRRQH